MTRFKNLDHRGLSVQSTARATGLRTGWRSRVLLASLFIGAGCQDNPLSNQVGEVPRVSTAVIHDCGSSSSGANMAVKRWDCGDTVIFTDLPEAYGVLLNSWNNWLGSYNPSGAPIFLRLEEMPSGGVGQSRRWISVYFDVSADGTYCGEWSVPGKVRGGEPSNTDGSIWVHPPVGLNCGSATAVLANELAGIVGIIEGADKYMPTGGDPFMDHCTRFLRGGLAVNGTVCAHEAEDVLAAYGIRSGPSLGYVLNHIVTGYELSIADSVVVHVGDTLPLSVSALHFDGANPSLSCLLAAPGDSNPGHNPTCSPEDLGYTWTVSDSNIVTLSGSGSSRTMVGSAAGTATILVGISDPGPYAIATLVNRKGIPASLTVRVTGPIPQIAVDSGDFQTGGPGATLPNDLVVKLTSGGAPVSGVMVTFAAGGGSISHASATTDAAGRARTTWTLGYTLGIEHVSATVSGGGAGVTFTATVVQPPAGPPTDFRRVDCYQDLGREEGLDYISHFLAWNNAPGSTGWQIVAKTSADTTGSMNPSAVGGSQQNYEVGPNLFGGKQFKYYFIRNMFGADSSSWIAMTPQKINVTGDASCRIVY